MNTTDQLIKFFFNIDYFFLFCVILLFPGDKY